MPYLFLQALQGAGVRGFLMVQSLKAAAKAAHEAEWQAWCLLQSEHRDLPAYFTRSQIIAELPQCEALYVEWESAVDALDEALKAVDLS